MRKKTAQRQLTKLYRKALSELNEAQKVAYVLDAVNMPGNAEDQALLALHHTLANVDYARHALDIAEFDTLFESEIDHFLCGRPTALPLSIAVQQVENLLVARGHSFRIGF